MSNLIRIILVIILLFVFMSFVNNIEDTGGLIGKYNSVSGNSKYYYAKIALFIIALWGILRVMTRTPRNSRQKQDDQIE